MKYKQVILTISSLKLPKGKLAAQCAHASVEATLRADKEVVTKWRNEGMAKIVVKVNDEKELYKHLQMAKDAGVANAKITDAGHTVVEPGTVTCGAIGPGEQEEVDSITGQLKLL